MKGRETKLNLYGSHRGYTHRPSDASAWHPLQATEFSPHCSQMNSQPPCSWYLHHHVLYLSGAHPFCSLLLACLAYSSTLRWRQYIPPKYPSTSTRFLFGWLQNIKTIKLERKNVVICAKSRNPDMSVPIHCDCFRYGAQIAAQIFGPSTRQTILQAWCCSLVFKWFSCQCTADKRSWGSDTYR